MTRAEYIELIEWHNQRLRDLNYSPEIMVELIAYRTKWIATIKRK